MEFGFIGEILGDPDPADLSLQRWIEMVRDHPSLVRPQPREIINPFTKQPTVVHPRPDIARVVVDGKEVGLMGWAEDDSMFISVYGEPEVMVPLARQVAQALGGRFEEKNED